MLASIKINNVALIDNLEINFGDKLNVVSGETGSGKSIILNALGFVIGDRLDKSLLRENTEFMKVDAIFLQVSNSVCEKIKEIAGCETQDSEILISREFSINGKTSCKINGQTVTTSMLKNVASLLIDIHGQHQHQALLNNDYQLNILDNFCKNELINPLKELNSNIDKLNEINSQLKQLGGNAQEKQNLIDLYSYQLNEIKNANISESEFDNLKARLNEMKESEKISTSLNDSIKDLDKNPYGQSASEQLNSAKKSLSILNNISEKYQSLTTRVESLSIELEDTIGEIYSILSSIEYDEQEFNQLDERLDYIKNLFHKYGGDYHNIQNYYADIELKLNNLINSEERYNELTLEKNNLLAQIENNCKVISNIRRKNALNLEKSLECELRKLGMKDAKFIIQFNKTSEPFTRLGYDYIEFMFSANLGFEPKPLNKIASGGELSRFMLAYKIVVNTIDQIDTLIFDEIDTGISGNIANVVASSMGRLAKTKQLIVVSHLPQICAMADDNFLVEKFTTDITKTVLTKLDENGTYKEIARLMGIMDNLDYAKKLKQQADEFKNTL